MWSTVTVSVPTKEGVITGIMLTSLASGLSNEKYCNSYDVISVAQAGGTYYYKKKIHAGVSRSP